MNRNSFLVGIFLFFSIVLFAQNAPNKIDESRRKQGHWIKYDENHKKIYDGNFKDDVPVGLFTYFYNTGIIKATALFSNNGTVTYSKLFDAGGNFIAEGKYVNQKKDSLWRFYGRDSLLVAEEVYSMGVKNGASRVYYSNGNLAEEKNWKSGVLNGPYKKYFEGGELKYSGQHVNGKLEGKVTFYFASGNVDAEGVYKNDLKEGIWNYYNEDGKVRRTDTYINGVMLNSDKDVITKEEQEEEKKQYQQFEVIDPFQEGFRPPR